MKISIFVLHLGFGGIEKYAITIANMLQAQHEVEIISTYKIVNTPSFSLNNQVKVTYLISDLKPNAAELKRALTEKNYGAVVREGLHAIKVLWHKYWKNKNAIQNCSGDIIISTRDYHNTLIQKYAPSKIVKITSEHNHHNHNPKYINKVISSCKEFDYMLPISKELTSFYADKLPSVKVRYIPFCIEKPSVAIGDRETIPWEPVFINVGRLSPEKGSIELIDIFAKISKRIPKAKLHIVGDGVLMEAIQTKIAEYCLQENVIIHGFLHKAKIDQLYSESDVFLMTSHTESFGFVLLEAMACGVPCIAYSSAQGATEIIHTDINGYLIQDRNEFEYVNKAIALCDDAKKREQLKYAMKETVKAYSVEATNRGWLDLIEECNYPDLTNRHS